jgi:hypothetical protein
MSADSCRNIGGASGRVGRDLGYESYESKAECLFGAELTAGQAQFHRPGFAYRMFDGAENENRPISNPNVGKPKARFLMRDHHVSVSCQTGTAVENGAVNRGDNRFVDALNSAEQAWWIPPS